MSTRTPFFLLILGLCGLTPLTLPAQVPEAGAAGSMQLVDSDDASCAAGEARLTGARRPRNSMCIVGVAQHPGGIMRVLVNGAEAVLQAEPAGGTRFIGFVPNAALRRDLEIIAFPGSGTPIAHLYGLVEADASGGGGYLMRKEMAAVAAEAAGNEATPEAAPAGQGTLVILEPREWMGEGTRSVRVPSDGSVRVVGRAHHPAGVVRVMVAGREAALLPHPSGSMQFITYVSGEVAAKGVEVILHPARGEPLARVVGVDPALAAAPAPAVPAPAAPAGDGTAGAEPAAPVSPGAITAAEAAPAPADGGAVAMGPRHYLEIHEPGEWTGAEARSLAVPMRQSVRIVGEAMHQNGVKTVLINNARASVQPQPNGAVRFIGYVPVRSAAQAVEVRVEGQSGAALRRQFTLDPQPAARAPDFVALQPGQGFRGQRWAVVVGISQYQDSGITALKYADRDAQAVYDFLTSERAGGGGFNPDNIKLLLNEEATYQALRSALFTFLKSSTEDDQVIIYFAGHGAPDPQRRDDLFLLAYDTRKEDISGTAFPMYDVRNAVQRVLARDILVLTDACHGGGVGEALGMRNLEANMINDIFLTQLNASTGGIVTFTASMANQTSAEDERWGGGHGIFTYYLLQALAGAADEDGDGIVTLVEMMEWTKDRVRRETQNAQIPTISTTAYDQLWPMSIVVRQPDGVLAATPTPRRLASPAAPTRTVDTPAGAPAAGGAAAAPTRPGLPAQPAAVQPGVAPEVLRQAREKVQLFPNSAAYWNELAEVLREAGETEEAVSAFQNATRLEPNHAEYRYNLGILLRDSGKPDAAVLALREAARLAPRSAQYLNGLGAAMLQAQQVAPAVEEYRKAVRIEPGKGVYQRDLGHALGRTGRSRDALAAYEEALRLEPSVAQYHAEYAELLVQAGRLPEAVSALQAAVRLDRTALAYHSALAELLQSLGRAQEAVAAYRGAAQLDPENAEVRYRLGVLHRSLGMQYETIEAFREAVRLGPETALYRFELGTALRGSARPEDALPEYQAALRLEPQNAQYRNGYGLALHRAGQAKEALDELREAQRLAPGNARYLYDTALLLREAGELDEAITQLEQAIRLDKNSALYKEELRSVKRLKSAQAKSRS